MSNPQSFSLVGFCGSRSLAGVAFDQCGSIARAIADAGSLVAVGDARGADQAVRLAVPGAHVFSAWNNSRGLLAERSIRLVRFLADSHSNSCLFAFPGSTCPAQLVPSSQPSACFCGFGSGTWASAALAVGLAVPVRLFLPPELHPPALWGEWRLLDTGSPLHEWELS